MKLSDQALGAIMMALQNCLMNQVDIVPILKGFDLILNENEEVVVVNPPVVDTESSSEEPVFNFNESETTVGSD